MQPLEISYRKFFGFRHFCVVLEVSSPSCSSLNSDLKMLLYFNPGKALEALWSIKQERSVSFQSQGVWWSTLGHKHSCFEEDIATVSKSRPYFVSKLHSFGKQGFVLPVCVFVFVFFQLLNDLALHCFNDGVKETLVVCLALLLHWRFSFYASNGDMTFDMRVLLIRFVSFLPHLVVMVLRV